MTRSLRIKIGQRAHDRSRPGVDGIVSWIFPRHYSVRLADGTIKRVRAENAALSIGRYLKKEAASV